MGANDKALGGLMILFAALVFTYYTTWAIFLPLIHKSSPLHSYFPPREWAVRIPAFILAVGVSAIGLFIGSTIAKENRKKAEKAKLRSA